MNTTEKVNQSIIFEQPVGEAVRFCLRIEQLDKTLEQCMALSKEPMICHSATLNILYILQIISRTDFKSKITQIMNYYQNMMLTYKKQEGVNLEAIDNYIETIDQSLAIMHHSQQNLGMNLLTNPILQSVNQHIYSNGGPSLHQVPAYLSWLNMTAEDRDHDLKSWYREIKSIIHIAKIVIELVRSHSKKTHQIAYRGFFSEELYS